MDAAPPKSPTDLASLRPNPRNPRKVTDAKLQMLQRALVEFGDLGGIIFNRRTGHLVGGHMRVQAFAAAQRGSKVQVQLVREHPKPSDKGTVAEGHVELGGERYSYRVVDWPKERELAANLAANKGAGEFDLPLLTDILGELTQVSMDLDLTMFDQVERDSLMPAPEMLEEDPGEGEGTEEVPQEAKTKLGDLYQLGEHRLLCGDCTDPNAIDRLMAGQKADMVYTDPPYGISLDVDYANKQGKAPGWKGPKHRKVHGDDIPFDAQFLLTLFPDAAEVFLWGAENYAQSIPPGGSWVCWDKKLEAHDAYSSGGFELCWSKKRHHYQLARIVWTGFLAVERGEKRHHPTQKPIALACWFFERWGKDNDVVVDLYGGSGSTLLACQEKARRCYTMEIDPRYCDLIVKRWEDATGESAVLLPAGGLDDG